MPKRLYDEQGNFTEEGDRLFRTLDSVISLVMAEIRSVNLNTQDLRKMIHGVVEMNLGAIQVHQIIQGKISDENFHIQDEQPPA